MTLLDALQIALGPVEAATGGMLTAEEAAANLARLMASPATRINLAAPAQQQRPDFRAGLFRAQPAERGLGSAAAFDPRLKQFTHSEITWRALFARRDIGGV